MPSDEPLTYLKNFLIVPVKATIFNTIVLSMKNFLTYSPEPLTNLVLGEGLTFFYSFPVCTRPILVVCGLPMAELKFFCGLPSSLKNR
jgi:hypothetical protein